MSDPIMTVQLYRTLAKVTLSNTFSITGGPTRSSITLYNAGSRRFATQGSDNYDGTGTTQTSSFVATTAGSNANSNVWYVGENIRPAGSSISSAADRNSSKAPANASYIRITSATQLLGNVPAIGEEYIMSNMSFTYDIYLGKSTVLSDFSLRRHTNYTITSAVSGTLAAQEYLAANDGRVRLSKTESEAVGLCIGLFGGASGYTTGTSAAYTITGSYTKMLLLAPTSTQGSSIKWSDDETTQYQTESRKYWDHTYTSANIEKGSGYAYDYCNSLNVNGVTGWYLPTQAQLMAIWAMKQGISDSGKFADYAPFAAVDCWSSTEISADYAWYVNFGSGFTNNISNKVIARLVRCVRDL
ncbi:Lcl domain-containing protein [Parabacteroides chinchillae]|uniref:Lcl domain-containing protein n=1 Tax=Parabacteroides chinchillae TaxID=871327 RepID=UPI001F48549C|nr:DUF1566 domain-containing protein [Parabacteroides chinchillae]